MLAVFDSVLGERPVGPNVVWPPSSLVLEGIHQGANVRATHTLRRSQRETEWEWMV